MKAKLMLLFGMALVPLASSVYAQNAKAVFFNKGQMSIVGQSADKTKTILYVGGDFVVSRDATDNSVKSKILVKNSQTVITGDFIQSARFVEGDGSLGFVVPETFSEYKDIASRIVFRGTDVQHIKKGFDGETKYDGAWKSTNYVDFPDIVVENPNTVVLAPEMAVKTKNLVLNKGRFVVDSRRFDKNTDNSKVNKDAIGNDILASSLHGDRSIVAFLDVDPEGDILYNNRTFVPTTPDELKAMTAVQVRLTLDEPLADGVSAITSANVRSLVGMGSPFDQLSADYFSWNHVFTPIDQNIVTRAISKPETVLPAGRGFIAGIDLRGSVVNNYALDYRLEDLIKDTDAFSNRVKDTYVFDRFSFGNENNIYPLKVHGTARSSSIRLYSEFKDINVPVNGLNMYSETIAEATLPYQENLNYKDVTVKLNDGYTYLSNPFTTPLDISDLLSKNLTRTTGWGDFTTGASVNNYDIYNRVWILNPTSYASGTHRLISEGKDVSYGEKPTKVHAFASFLTYSKTGATGDGSTMEGNQIGNGATIAPLQMFVLSVRKGSHDNKPTEVTIPASKKVITKSSLFLRSTENIVEDDFLFQVTDTDTKAFDRVAVVIRTPEQIQEEEFEDVDKLLTLSYEVSDSNTDLNLRTITGSDDQVNGNVNNILYTKSQTGSMLETKFLPATANASVKTTTLFLKPGVDDKEVSIKAGRLNSMNRVRQIILVDNLNNKETELSDGSEYLAKVSATDVADRFTLKFILNGSGSIEEDIQNTSKGIYSYYSSNTLTVGGFSDKDLNSTLAIYDLQGRLLTQTKVDRLEMNIPVSYAYGAYIVKVQGNNSYVSKFLVK